MDAIAIFLLVVVIIICLVVMVSNFYILVYFSHPEDGFSKGIWVYRSLVIGVLSFAGYLIFAIPLDIACAKRDDSMQLPYDMTFFWTAINFVICFVLMFVLPMAMILYSDDSDDFKDAVKNAAKIASLVAVFHIICVCIYVWVIGYAHIPTKHVVKTTNDFVASERKMQKDDLTAYYLATTIESHYIKVKLGILNSCTLHLTVIGSILLIFLGGYGLASLPMECLNSYLNRPQIRDAEDFVLTKFVLREENEKLVNKARDVKNQKEELNKTIGFLAQRAKKMALQKSINELKEEFLEFEDVIDCFIQEQNIQEVNPLVHYSYLILGCIGYLASFIIIFHT